MLMLIHWITLFIDLIGFGCLPIPGSVISVLSSTLPQADINHIHRRGAAYWVIADSETQTERRGVRENRRGCLLFVFKSVNKSTALSAISKQETSHFEASRGSLLLDVDNAWKSRVSMVCRSEPSAHCPAVDADSEREGLVEQLVSKSSLLSNRRFGCSLVFVIFLLLQLEIVIVPLSGAALSSRNARGYFVLNNSDDREQHQIWKRSISSLTNQQERSSGSRGESDQSTLNVSLSENEIILDEWKHADGTADDAHRQSYHSVQFVLFTFTTIRNGKTESFTTSSPEFHIIELQPQEKLTVNCRASLLGLGEDMDVLWWKDDEFIPATNSSIMVSDDRDLGLYRCVADVAIVSTDLLDSYLVHNRVKRSETEMPAGKVLSNGVIVRRAVALHFTLHPENVTVANGSVFRLECFTNGSQPQPIVWFKNETEIVENNSTGNIHIYTVEHHSVLHGQRAAAGDSGRYRCRSGGIYSNAAVVSVIPEDESTDSVKSSLVVKELPSELSVPASESVILECLTDDSQASSLWRVVDEYGQPIRKYQTDEDGSDVAAHTALVIRSASAQDNGKYTCTVPGKTVSTFITVQVAPLLLLRRKVRRIAETLGTTTRLRCSASVEPHDTSFQINWYKDGKRVVSFGRAKLQPEEGFTSEIVVNEMGVSMVEFTKDLLLSNVQQSDQGLYQCIASNAVGERSAFIGLVVEAEIDAAITNLKVTVDHKNAQFNLKWRLPHRMYYLDAFRSVFLLNYYLSDGGSANNVPLRNADCTPDNWCVANCCSSNYVFLARRNYTFQMSLLKMDTVGKITPLSEHVTAVSWDGVAQKALDLIVSRRNEESLELSWEHPSIDVANGVVQKYTIEYYKDSEAIRAVKRRDVEADATSYILKGMESGAVYRFRVIPVTRHGVPSSVHLKTNANYTFIGYLLDSAHEKLRPEIGSVPFDVEQKDTSITVRWKGVRKLPSNTSHDAENQAVLIRYARSDLSPLKEKAEESLLISGAMNLSAKFDTSRTYQFCSRLYDGIFHGPDFCCTYRLPPTSLNDVFGDLPIDAGLPRPVWCDQLEGKECRCEPSYEFGDAMRVSWDWPANDYSADEFVVHYTLSDSIIHEDDRLVITDDAFADLPNLRSNTTYRIMVEARNKLGGVEGSWFNCTTPALRQIPAPTGVLYEELNATAVRVSWNSIHPNPRWSTPVGYVIQIQSSSGSAASVTDIPVDGMGATSYVVTLQPNMLYTFQVAARSSSGDLGLHSSPYLFAPSSHFSKNKGAGANELDEGGDAKKQQQKTFFSKSNREGILIGIVLAVGLLTLCFGGICAHLRLKRRKLEMGLNASAAAATAASKASADVQRIPNTSYEMEELITRRKSDDLANEETGPRNVFGNRIRHLPPRSSLSSENEALYLDTKGGEQGALPSGQDKYLRLLSDKKQLRRFRESGLLRSESAAEGTSTKSHVSCRKNTPGANLRRELTIAPKNPSHHLLLDSKWIRAACGTSNLWTGSLPSKKRISSVDSTTTRSLRARYLNTSRTSESSCENAIVMPRFFSKLPAFSDFTRLCTASNTEPLNQTNSYTSIICPRSASVQSNYQQNGLIKQRVDGLKRMAPITSNTARYPYNAASNQSLAYCDAGSIENGDCLIIRSPREYHHHDNDAIKMCSIGSSKGGGGVTAACSSMPNLTDSGIVYDEMHYHPPPLLLPGNTDNSNLLES